MHQESVATHNTCDNVCSTNELSDESESMLQDLLGSELPPAPMVFGKHLPSVQAGPMLAICAGPIWGNEVRFTGKFGGDLTQNEAEEAVALTAKNMLVQLELKCGGDFGRVQGCLRLGGIFQSTEEFRGHSAFMDIASDMILKVVGERAAHTRYCYSALSMPSSLSIELEAWFWLEK